MLHPYCNFGYVCLCASKRFDIRQEVNNCPKKVLESWSDATLSNRTYVRQKEEETLSQWLCKTFILEVLGHVSNASPSSETSPAAVSVSASPRENVVPPQRWIQVRRVNKFLRDQIIGSTKRIVYDKTGRQKERGWEVWEQFTWEKWIDDGCQRPKKVYRVYRVDVREFGWSRAAWRSSE